MNVICRQIAEAMQNAWKPLLSFVAAALLLHRQAVKRVVCPLHYINIAQAATGDKRAVISIRHGFYEKYPLHKLSENAARTLARTCGL